MSEYAGLCIGGPMAGQSAVSHSTKLVVHMPPPLTLKERLQESVKETIPADWEDVTYNWLHTGGLGLWIVEGKNMNDAITEMALAYQEKMDVQRSS